MCTSSVLSQAVELVSIAVLHNSTTWFCFTVETVVGEEVTQGTALPEAFYCKWEMELS